MTSPLAVPATPPSSILVESFKGGVGKTSTAWALARAAHQSGRHALAVSLCPQNDFDLLTGRHTTYGLREQLRAGQSPTHHRSSDGVAFVPAGYADLDGHTDLAPLFALVRRFQITVIEGVGFNHDVAFEVSRRVERVVVPAMPRRADISGALRAIEYLDRVGVPATVLLTQVPPPSWRTKQQDRLLELLYSAYPNHLLSSRVRLTGRVGARDGDDLAGGAHDVTRVAGVADDYRAVAVELGIVAPHGTAGGAARREA